MPCLRVDRGSRSSTSSRTPTFPDRETRSAGRDIDELLEAGIDVISTLNIQHLESLNDVVEEITGVKRRETSPTPSCGGPTSSSSST
jgi:hypothetical protein